MTCLFSFAMDSDNGPQPGTPGRAAMLNSTTGGIEYLRGEKNDVWEGM